MISKKIIVPARHIIVRELLPPAPMICVDHRPHEMLWQLLDARGRIIKEADSPIHNLVLNQGRDALAAQFGFTQQSNFAVVGTASGAAQPTDTGMAVERARTSAVPSGESDSASRVSNGVYNVRRVKQFTAAQVGNHNLTHWGFSGAASAGQNLMCLEQFRDGSNNPITLTPDADQQLRLIYISRITVGPVVPTAGAINIANIGNRTGQFIVYGSVGATGNIDLQMLDNAASGNIPTSPMFRDFFMVRSAAPGLTYSTDTNNMAAAFDERPITVAAYVPGSRQRLFNNIVFPSGAANMEIRAMGYGHLAQIPDRRGFAAAFVFDAGQQFTKTNLNELVLTGWGVSWT